MKNERMCNIVKDLLPLYIDDLCSEDSKQMVEEHIKGCDECKRALELMKDGESEVATNFSRMDETDEQLMKRVSKDINKKTKRFKKISIACLGMVVVLLFGLFAPVVSVSSQEFKVSVENFDKSQCSIDDQAEVIENFEEDTIFLNDPDETNDSEKYRRIIIPFGEATLMDMSDYSKIAIQDKTEFEEVSVIKFSTNKIIKGYTTDLVANEDGETYTLRIKNPKTTLLNNSSNYEMVFADIELCKVTKVAVVNGSNEEVIYGE